MSDPTIRPKAHLQNFAFYYPGHLWYRGDSIKNLLLFFDGVALLVPNYKKHEPELLDPVIASPLLDRGLLQILEAEMVVDKVATTKLAEVMTDVLTSGALDSLAKEDTTFHELSFSRLGWFGDRELAAMILDELKVRGLARASEDGFSIPMHPMVRALVLVLLAQILRPYGNNLNLELSPVTDRPKLIDALREILSLSSTPSVGKVVAFDLETVGVDLSRVPMDEVLSFREEHLEEFQAYAKNVRRFVNELSLMPDEEREAAFDERQAEIEVYARQLKDVSRKAWKRPASFALSIAGATWTLASGNPIGAILAAGSAILGKKSRDENVSGAYSYIFRAGTDYV